MKRSCFLVVLIGIWAMASTAFASPYATEVVDFSGPFGGSPYNDPNAVLGKPSTVFYDSWGNKTGRVKLVEAAWSTAPDGSNLITTLNPGSHITVKFDHRVEDDAANPFGVDFLVFGNAFYVGSGWVSDATNMDTYNLTGGGYFENTTVSVSQNGTDWYTYANGPYGDTAFPTQAFEWDSNTHSWTDNEMDFTKPVDPSLAATLAGGGLTAAEAIALYDGSGGGTGFDLAESGFDWIQYIRVEGSGGEIDAFSDVAPVAAGSPVPVPGSIFLLATGMIGLAGLRRRMP